MTSLSAVRIVDAPPAGVAARSFDLSTGPVTISVNSLVTVASTSPVTVSWGANQVLASWFDPFAKPRSIRYVGDLIITGFGFVTVWGAQAIAGSAYEPMSTNYTPSYWRIDGAGAYVEGAAQGEGSFLGITTPTGVMQLDTAGLTIQQGAAVASLTTTSLAVATVDTATIYNGVAGSAPGVFVNDQLRVGNTLTVLGPIVSTSSTGSAFAANLRAPTFEGGLRINSTVNPTPPGTSIFDFMGVVSDDGLTGVMTIIVRNPVNNTLWQLTLPGNATQYT